jgi:large subunit ribosomal protein L21
MDMFAIVRTGGKQYRVEPGTTIRVEKLEETLGSEIELKEVLFLSADETFVGEPTVEKASVKAVVTQQAKGPKVLIFKKKRRKGYRRLKGHRQLFTELFVTSVTSPDGKTEQAKTKPNVIDPEKQKERKEKARAIAQEKKKAASKSAAPKKAATKKATKKKTATKKKKVAKKTAKKKTAKKKTAKKAATKKTTKKK